MFFNSLILEKITCLVRSSYRSPPDMAKSQTSNLKSQTLNLSCLVFACGDLVEGEGTVEHLIAALAVGGVFPIEG